ncbi:MULTISPECIES: diacylglycerol kinase family protein [unclassified Streptomyces]|uniref:diacylglycerol kinase family protein n=1 Tax=unclassified Streptomyces TaxID=2593676 RepID=UPI0006F4658B|nr:MULTISPECIES: diacylglycerol kinase family protein [unclassified Streptomyces]KQX47874.1 sphingosine kinase [Streptomyces sp. Root1304]KRA82266.1 sphingosine kinase [Streptomyces sp. Root66D1]
MTSDITLFVNPTAGRGRGAHAAQPAAAALRDAGFSVRTVLGHDAADALRRAREAVAAGTGALVAVGGDGMISLALQAVAGTRTPLGIIAAGTGNDFARTLGLPVGDPAAAGRVAAEVLKTTGGRSVDLGRIEGGAGAPGASGGGAAGDGPAHAAGSGTGVGAGRWYGTVLASGFDSRVNDRGNRMRIPAGRFKYDLAILAELAGFRPVPYRLTLDGGRVVETDATLVAVGNGTSYGGGMRICADARTDDGLLDVTVVGDCDRRTLIKVFPRVYKGTHLDHPKVTTYRVRSLILDAPGTTGYADGEPLGPLPLTVTCVSGALRVLAP